MAAAVGPSFGLRGLVGAWVRRERRSGETVEVDVENVRSGLLRRVGTITFTGVQAVAFASERPFDPRAAEPTMRGRVTAVHAETGSTGLELELQSGPADVDHHRFTIRHTGVITRLPPSLDLTLRGLIGLYPGARDLKT